MRYVPVLVMVILFLLPTASARDPYIIEGTISTDNSVVENAKVTLILDSQQIRYSTNTDSNGAFGFIIDNYNEGQTYSIEVEYKGQTAFSTGRVLIYDKEGYQRSGDVVNLTVNATQTQGYGIDTFLIFFFVVIVLVYLLIEIRKIRNESDTEWTKRQQK